MDTPENIRRGCLDCKYRETPVANLPCKNCERWSKWADPYSIEAEEKPKRKRK